MTDAAGKIVDPARAAARAQRARAAGLRVVLTSGVFDLLEARHVRLLHAARIRGDILLCAVHGDAATRALLGEGRPVLPLAERMELIAATRGVDVVFPLASMDTADAVARVAPHVYVAGRESRLDARRVPHGVAVVEADDPANDDGDAVARILAADRRTES